LLNQSQGLQERKTTMLYFEPWKKYATFSGRARRSEFWVFMLINNVIAFILWGITMKGAATYAHAVAEAAQQGMPAPAYSGGSPMIVGLLILFSLIILLPSLAVSVRRLHDTGRSGWFFFLGFIPIVGGIIMLVLYCIDSQAGDNQYGSNPKGVAAPPPPPQA